MFQFHPGSIKGRLTDAGTQYLLSFNSTLVLLKAGQLSGCGEAKYLRFNSTLVLLKEAAAACRACRH